MILHSTELEDPAVAMVGLENVSQSSLSVLLAIRIVKTSTDGLIGPATTGMSWEKVSIFL